MVANGKTCVNRRKNKHSIISLKSVGNDFDATTKVKKVIAFYDTDPATPVEFSAKKATFGNTKRRRIHLKGEKVRQKGKFANSDEPITGTLQITLETGTVVGVPAVNDLPNVVFVDDGDSPDDTP